MPYNTKQLVRDAGQNAIPQIFNPTTDAYEAAQGANGKQFMRASELEDLIGAQTAAAVTDTTLNATVIAALKGNTKQLQTTEGTDSTGVTPLTGGTGLKGWLSGIFKRASDILTTLTDGTAKAQIQGSVPAGTNLIGLVKLSDGMDVLVINANGSLNVVQVNAAGVELFTAGNAGKVELNAQLPAGTNNIGDVDLASVPKVGAHANAWNNATVVANGTSASVNCADTSVITVFGNSNTATEITVQHSQNGTQFYDSTQTITLSAPGDFVLTFDSAAAHHRLKSSVAGLITATIAGKA